MAFGGFQGLRAPRSGLKVSGVLRVQECMAPGSGLRVLGFRSLGPGSGIGPLSLQPRDASDDGAADDALVFVDAGTGPNFGFVQPSPLGRVSVPNPGERKKDSSFGRRWYTTVFRKKVAYSAPKGPLQVDLLPDPLHELQEEAILPGHQALARCPALLQVQLPSPLLCYGCMCR